MSQQVLETAVYSVGCYQARRLPQRRLFVPREYGFATEERLLEAARQAGVNNEQQLASGSKECR